MSLLHVTIPNICIQEQRYALEIILGEFLGLELEVTSTNYVEDIEISLQGNNSQKLLINCDFFKQAELFWLKNESMPTQPLKSWLVHEDSIQANLVSCNIPVLYGQPGLVKGDDDWQLNLDIFGSAFFMLTRYEELITNARDKHGRFSANDSIAFKEGLLDRPIINEYVEILWFCLSSLWPCLSRKTRSFRKLISCDVDHPFDHVGRSAKKTVLRVGARVLRDKNIKLAMLDSLNYLFTKLRSNIFDQYRQNIDWIMNVNQSAGNKVSFYFIPSQTDENREDSNDIRQTEISDILSHIVNSGHYVGIHPGYKTYNHSTNFTHSANVFKQALVQQGIEFIGIGGRQHYLMYDVAQTPHLWQEHGFSYDSTLGYSDKAGFRCGVCYEYSMYDLINRKSLNLKQRPLIVMDCTIIDKAYEGLGFSKEAFKRFKLFEFRCRKFDGDFTLLWHNSYFHNTKAKMFYQRFIK